MNYWIVDSSMRQSPELLCASSPPEEIAEVRRLYYAEHWKIGTIAAQLGLHPDTVRAAVATDALNRPRIPPPIPTGF